MNLTIEYKTINGELVAKVESETHLVYCTHHEALTLTAAIEAEIELVDGCGCTEMEWYHEQV